MKQLTRRFFAANAAVIFLVSLSSGVVRPTYAFGLPVIDASNLSQNIVTATENVAHTLKQIQQYQTQLQQYENMLQNTTAPAQQIWDSATVTMNQLRGSIDTLNGYKNSLGSIDAYLGKFKDLADYRNSPCYSYNGCTQAQWAAMTDSERLGSESQLKRLQTAATGATGQLEAIGYASQLASHQSNQLLQIRGLLIAQQNAIATRNQALADREAKEAAAAIQLRAGPFHQSPAMSW
jgi:P-type conjugative transfer protein TrbJ